MTDFDLAVRVIGSDGTTERVDLNDIASGFAVARPFVEPEESRRDIRVVAPRVAGSFRVAEAQDDSTFTVRVYVYGSSWAQVESRWQTVRAALFAEADYFLEVETRGVLKRWRTERPDVIPEPVDGVAQLNNRLTYQIRFRVQPNPSVTIV